MSRIRKRLTTTAATLAASLDALVEARIAARRRDLADAERLESRAPLRAIVRRMGHVHGDVHYSIRP